MSGKRITVEVIYDKYDKKYNKKTAKVTITPKDSLYDLIKKSGINKNFLYDIAEILPQYITDKEKLFRMVIDNDTIRVEGRIVPLDKKAILVDFINWKKIKIRSGWGADNPQGYLLIDETACVKDLLKNILRLPVNKNKRFLPVPEKFCKVINSSAKTVLNPESTFKKIKNGTVLGIKINLSNIPPNYVLLYIRIVSPCPTCGNTVYPVLVPKKWTIKQLIKNTSYEDSTMGWRARNMDDKVYLDNYNINNLKHTDLIEIFPYDKPHQEDAYVPKRLRVITVIIDDKKKSRGENVEVEIQEGTTATDIRQELGLSGDFKVVRSNGKLVPDNADLYQALADKETIHLIKRKRKKKNKGVKK